jgi:hypothetical protein
LKQLNRQSGFGIPVILLTDTRSKDDVYTT